MILGKQPPTSRDNVVPALESSTATVQLPYANGWLLLALVCVLLILPTVEQISHGDVLLRVGLTVVLGFAVLAVFRRDVWLIFSLVTAAIIIPIVWLSLVFEQRGLFLISSILISCFFAWMAVRMVVSLFRQVSVSLDSILGVVSAYLLLGLAWAMLYLGIYHLENPDEFSELPMFSELVYFSFVTMSSLGYGDVTPTTPITRTLAWMQSVTGQFYLAILVAWLVSDLSARRRLCELEARENPRSD